MFLSSLYIQIVKKKVKWSRYRSGVAQRVGRGIALLFHDRGTRRRWVVSSTSRPHITPEKDPITILQEAGWAPGPVWTGGKSRPHRDWIPDRPGRSQSLCRLSYPTHTQIVYLVYLSTRTGITESVLRFAMDWTVRGSNPGGMRDIPCLPDRSRGPPSILCKGYWVFPGVN